MSNLEMDDIKEKCAGFCSKFFSVVIAIVLDVITLVYTIGAGHLISAGSFKGLGLAHFLGIVSAIAAAGLYTLLHFVPKRAYRLMYLITCLLVASLFLVSHSLGITAPTVDDCDEMGFLNATSIIRQEAHTVGDISWIIVEGGNGTQAIGRLGQPLGDCTASVVTFVTALMIILLQLIALFDTQRMLLTRVRSKTYGERFVEMGIR